MSRVYENTLHSVVCLDGEPVYDPNPDYREEPFSAEDVGSHMIFGAINPAVLVGGERPDPNRVPTDTSQEAAG
jgi:hypothetical protein